jgi:hypothetical protein
MIPRASTIDYIRQPDFLYFFPAHISDGVRETGCFFCEISFGWWDLTYAFGIEPGAGQGLKAFVSIIFSFSLGRCLICLLACEEVHEYALHLRCAFVYDAGLVPSYG